MKKLLCLLLLSACASHRGEGPWVLPRGKQIHTIKVSRENGPASLFQFQSLLLLTETSGDVVALSPFGTTLFRVHDLQDKSDFVIEDLSPILASREWQLRLVYSRLRNLFWLRSSDIPRELELRERDANNFAKLLSWHLHGYRVDIEVIPQ